MATPAKGAVGRAAQPQFRPRPNVLKLEVSMISSSWRRRLAGKLNDTLEPNADLKKGLLCGAVLLAVLVALAL